MTIALVRLATSALLAVACVLAGWVVEAHYGLNIWDEGFLWYGVQRVQLGEIPIRDFMAYDPARYYWTAAVMALWGGKGILDVRAAVAVFQWLGLAAGIWVVASGTRQRGAAFLVCAAIVLALWMFPRHKLFDIALSVLFVAVFAWWLRRPSLRRHFACGLFIGIAACFGRNHGVYALVASALGFAWLGMEGRRLPRWEAVLSWMGGIAAGFVPIIVACMVVPGFAAAFWQSILFLLELGATNLTLPVPWPWTVPYSDLPTGVALRGGLIGLGFIGVLVYPAMAALRLVRRSLHHLPADPALAATFCLAVPYAHYAYSRADLGHLAQGIFPALVGTLLWLAAARPGIRWTGVAAILAATAWITLPSHPRMDCVGSDHPCVATDVSGQRLYLPPPVAGDISLLRDLDATYAPGNRAFVATPYWPGAYAVLGKRSPLWEIYATTARSERFQQAEIARMQQAHPGFVIVFDFPLDNREELRYSHTHPAMDAYIKDHFVALPSPNANYRIYRAPDHPPEGK